MATLAEHGDKLGLARALNDRAESLGWAKITPSTAASVAQRLPDGRSGSNSAYLNRQLLIDLPRGGGIALGLPGR